MARAAIAMAILALFAFAAVANAQCHESCYNGVYAKNKAAKEGLWKACAAKAKGAPVWSQNTCGCPTHVKYCFNSKADYDAYQACEKKQAVYGQTLGKVKKDLNNKAEKGVKCIKSY